tara:strand:+ start:1161 stop:1340 length:180 start_codon:yes stop_codon:yes gene_type:complete
MAKDNSIELAYNEFDTMVGKFLEQANVSFKDIVKPELPKQKKQKTKVNPLNKMANPFRI